MALGCPEREPLVTREPTTSPLQCPGPVASEWAKASRRGGGGAPGGATRRQVALTGLGEPASCQAHPLCFTHASELRLWFSGSARSSAFRCLCNCQPVEAARRPCCTLYSF